ncbi:HmuY family protein [Melaminivora sp.]|uniref:HmuY family protein n=1 Tax=Melaminivora sp. TaxID=1933032 RepID=UPI0028AB7CD9|nr:HmuY family protein [Melaminivora sp.]
MHPARPLHCLLTALATAALAACGGGGGGSSPSDDPAPPPAVTSKFTQKAAWTFALPAAGESVCYDFDARAAANCTGATWDVKVVSGGRSAELFTNSGASGSGAGGAFGGPFVHTWSELQRWNDALVDPQAGAIPAALYAPDAARGVFGGSNSIQSAAFEYDLNGTHQLHPNFRVFLITTNSASADIGGAAGPVFALQLTGYYGGPTGAASGWPSFRWIDTANPGTVRKASVNASEGWVYYDLASGSTTTASGSWHIAFNRYSVKLNGGVSGKGNVAGFLATTPEGFYGADGTPVVAKFNAVANLEATLADLTGSLTGPRTPSAWIKDAVGSQLSPAYTGTYPGALNYGWYSYYPTEAAAAVVGLGQHQLKAHPDAAALVRSGEGNSYARMHLAGIQYAPATPAHSGAQTWTFEFEVQPAPGR